MIKNFNEFITEDSWSTFANSDHFLNELHKRVGVDEEVIVKITEMEPIKRNIHEKDKKYIMSWEIIKKGS